MTLSPVAMTSESPEVNSSISLVITTAAKSPTRHASPPSAIPMIVMIAILLLLAVLNLCGNGFALVTIRMNPSLWTKTNLILASMLLSHFATGFSMICYNSYTLRLFSVSNNRCRLNAVANGLALVIKMTTYVSGLHTILVSLERYIAIVYPLHYESTFTDRTLKWAISVVWLIGIFIGMTFTLWLIDADVSKCTLIPADYQLFDVILYLLTLVCMFACYGKILAVAWRQSRRSGSLGPSQQTPTVAIAVQTNKAATTVRNIKESNNKKSLTGIRVPSEPAAEMSRAASSELTPEQQRQKIKSRRREFKAVYITGVIVGAIVVFGFLHHVGRVLAAIGYDPDVTGYIQRVGGALGTLNFATTWAIYTAMSKSYRHAYRQMLVRIGRCCCKNITLPANHSLDV